MQPFSQFILNNVPLAQNLYNVYRILIITKRTSEKKEVSLTLGVEIYMRLH